MKGFYWHAISYVFVNIFISVVIIVGLMTEDGNSFTEAIRNFGVYSTWIFWGIGLFSHWLSVFGANIFFDKNWEERKINEFMDDNN